MSYDGGRGPERVTGPRVDVLLRPQGVRVAGDFDATTSAWVGYQLFEHLEHHREKLGGVRLAGGFVVDLTRIDVLGGAGTRVLDQLVVEAEERGIDVELVVRPGSTTERGLRLVGLGCHVRGDTTDRGKRRL